MIELATEIARAALIALVAIAGQEAPAPGVVIVPAPEGVLCLERREILMVGRFDAASGATTIVLPVEICHRWIRLVAGRSA